MFDCIFAILKLELIQAKKSPHLFNIEIESIHQSSLFISIRPETVNFSINLDVGSPDWIKIRPTVTCSQLPHYCKTLITFYNLHNSKCIMFRLIVRSICVSTTRHELLLSESLETAGVKRIEMWIWMRLEICYAYIVIPNFPKIQPGVISFK